jgi:hypothetical protein
MPTATSFSAFGKGNGFPICLPKVDVSGFDKWTTFGGYNSDGEGSINLSLDLQRAMPFYWNLYAFDIDASSSSSLGGSLSRSGNLILQDGNSLPPFTQLPSPINRQCSYFNCFASETGSDTGASYNLNVRTIQIRRMYFGSTDNESNFIGLGFNQTSQLSASASQPNVSASCSIEFGSYFNTNAGSSYSFAFTTVGGIAVGCEAFGFAFVAGGGGATHPPVLDPVNLSAVSNFPAFSLASSVQMNNIVYYTY